LIGRCAVYIFYIYACGCLFWFSASLPNSPISPQHKNKPPSNNNERRQQDIYGAQIGTRKFDSSYLAKAVKVFFSG
jgi:hypothetical protein